MKQNQYNQPPFTSGGNPFGQFGPMTTNGQMNMNPQAGYNYNNAFAQQHHPVLESATYANMNNVVHNNMGKTLLSEHINEYNILVDSSDRTVEAYPSPYDFRLTFGGSGAQTIRHKGNNAVYYTGTPSPIIYRDFTNVKYVKLNYIILPRTLHMDVNGSDQFVMTPATTYDLTKNKYIVVKIRELSSDTILSTSKVISNDSFLLYPDKELGTDNYLWVTANGSRIYTNGDLKNIKQFSILLCDPKGNTLTAIDTTTGKPINMSALVDANTLPTYTPARIESLRELQPTISTHISFVFGVVENELNKNTKFDK